MMGDGIAAALWSRRFYWNIRWGLLIFFLPPTPLQGFQHSERPWEAQYAFRLDLGMVREYRARLVGTDSYGLFTWGGLVHSEKETSEYEFNLTLGTSDSLGSYTQTDLGAGEMISRIPFTGGQFFMVCEPLPQISWRFTGAVKDMGPFTCHQALGAFRGREYEVWFAPEIPVHIGPWKLQGVPGLVVLARDRAGAVSFILESWKPNQGILQRVERTDGCLDVEAYADLQRTWARQLMQRLKARLPRGAQLSLGDQNSLEQFD